MTIKTIDKLCCPIDKQDLKLQIFTKDTDLNVLEGLLTCRACKRKYPIIYGVPIMSPDEYRQPTLEKPIIDSWKIEHSTSGTGLLNED